MNAVVEQNLRNETLLNQTDSVQELNLDMLDQVAGGSLYDYRSTDSDDDTYAEGTVKIELSISIEVPTKR